MVDFHCLFCFIVCSVPYWTVITCEILRVRSWRNRREWWERTVLIVWIELTLPRVLLTPPHLLLCVPLWLLDFADGNAEYLLAASLIPQHVSHFSLKLFNTQSLLGRKALEVQLQQIGVFEPNNTVAQFVGLEEEFKFSMNAYLVHL